MIGNYRLATDDYLDANEGKGPICPIHGTEMFAADDHGRFSCLECGLNNPLDVTTGMRTRTPQLPQITEEMPEAEKAKVPGIFRMNLTPTRAEAALLRRMLNPNLFELGDYTAGIDAVEKERNAGK